MSSIKDITLADSGEAKIKWVESYMPVLNLIKKDAVVNVLPYGAVSVNQKGEKMADVKNLKDHVVKVYRKSDRIILLKFLICEKIFNVLSVMLLK